MLVPTKHPFYNLNSKKRLALILNTEVSSLKNIEETFFVSAFSKKVGHKKRNLFNPAPNYKKILKKINSLLCNVNLPNYIYAGVPDKDYLKNAVYHHQNKFIHNADIKSFFPSTQDSYVYGLFLHKFKMSEDIAKILTVLTTLPLDDKSTRHLPQGFPTSTILSSLAYFDLFNGIKSLCEKENIRFSLFVDDMTFSRNTRIPKSFLLRISSIVKKYDLSLHEKKIYRNSAHHLPTVTGIIITPGTNVFKATNSLQEKMYKNFEYIHEHKCRTYNEYIEFKKAVLSLEGQLQAIKRIEQKRQTPYIDKILKDIKNNFIIHNVKGAPYDTLYQEFKIFENIFKHRDTLLIEY